jgi:hypothetical protein
LVPFSPKHFLFTSAVEKCKNQNIQNYNFACGETQSLKLREGHRLWVIENIVLRRIFAPKRDEVAGGCRKMHIVEFHNLHSSPGIIRMIRSRRMRRPEYVKCMGKK